MRARIKRIKISPEAFLHIMETNTAWRVHEGVPKGSKVRGFCLDPYTSELNLFVENEAFELVEIHAEVAPLLITEFRKIQ